MTDDRYPLGTFDIKAPVRSDQIRAAITAISALPEELEATIDAQTERHGAAILEQPYRPGGWTRRQVVHHLVDSHVNAYVRTRLTLTEEVPSVRPYDEKAWAELGDARSAPLAPSLALLHGLHHRWTVLLESLAEPDFSRGLHHPEHGNLTLGQLVAMYAWHGRHHVAHVASEFGTTAGEEGGLSSR